MAFKPYVVVTTIEQPTDCISCIFKVNLNTGCSLDLTRTIIKAIRKQKLKYMVFETLEEIIIETSIPTDSLISFNLICDSIKNHKAFDSKKTVFAFGLNKK